MMQKAYPGDATVTVCHSRSKDLVKECQEADIIIAALGQPNFVKEEMVKRRCSSNRRRYYPCSGRQQKSGFKLTGDVKFDEVAPKCSFITPVPGGVGPMTIVSLMKNTLLAGKKLFTSRILKDSEMCFTVLSPSLNLTVMKTITTLPLLLCPFPA